MSNSGVSSLRKWFLLNCLQREGTRHLQRFCLWVPLPGSADATEREKVLEATLGGHFSTVAEPGELLENADWRRPLLTGGI